MKNNISEIMNAEIQCEKCKGIFKISDWVNAFDANDIHTKPVTICPKCLLDLLKKYTVLKCDIDNFNNLILKCIKKINRFPYDFEAYGESKFYISMKSVIERVDGISYKDDDLEFKWYDDAEYFFLNKSVKKMWLPKIWWQYECIEWKKEEGGPDYKFISNDNKTVGLEITQLSHNHFEINNKNSDIKYITSCLNSINVKEGYFENYLARCIGIIKDKAKKSKNYDDVDSLYLGIIGTESMVLWHYCFLDIILNNLNFSHPFKRIMII